MPCGTRSRPTPESPDAARPRTHVQRGLVPPAPAPPALPRRAVRRPVHPRRRTVRGRVRRGAVDRACRVRPRAHRPGDRDDDAPRRPGVRCRAVRRPSPPGRQRDGGPPGPERRHDHARDVHRGGSRCVHHPRGLRRPGHRRGPRRPPRVRHVRLPPLPHVGEHRAPQPAARRRRAALQRDRRVVARHRVARRRRPLGGAHPTGPTEARTRRPRQPGARVPADVLLARSDGRVGPARRALPLGDGDHVVALRGRQRHGDPVGAELAGPRGRHDPRRSGDDRSRHDRRPRRARRPPRQRCPDGCGPRGHAGPVRHRPVRSPRSRHRLRGGPHPRADRVRPGVDGRGEQADLARRDGRRRGRPRRRAGRVRGALVGLPDHGEGRQARRQHPHGRPVRAAEPDRARPRRARHRRDGRVRVRDVVAAPTRRCPVRPRPRRRGARPRAGMGPGRGRTGRSTPRRPAPDGRGHAAPVPARRRRGRHRGDLPAPAERARLDQCTTHRSRSSSPP